VGGTIEGLAVTYLPSGFRPTAAPTTTTENGVVRTTVTYRDHAGTGIDITATRTNSLPPPRGAASPTTTHGGKEARLIMNAGRDTITWQERPGIIFTITGPHSRQGDLYNIGHALSPSRN
jgi:hypothetical protein